MFCINSQLDNVNTTLRHFYANANTNTYTYRGACNLPYQWGKETIINYTYMALYMSLPGSILNSTI